MTLKQMFLLTTGAAIAVALFHRPVMMIAQSSDWHNFGHCFWVSLYQSFMWVKGESIMIFSGDYTKTYNADADNLGLALGWMVGFMFQIFAFGATMGGFVKTWFEWGKK